jgi:hypothetical protein
LNLNKFGLPDIKAKLEKQVIQWIEKGSSSGLENMANNDELASEKGEWRIIGQQ